jgi:Gpi18-like mannosyltransferase
MPMPSDTDLPIARRGAILPLLTESGRRFVRFAEGGSAAAVWLLAILLTAVKLAAFWAMAQRFGDFPQTVCQWDCAWYWTTVTDGYTQHPSHGAGVEQANWAFFPLITLIVRSAIWLFGDHGQATGIGVSTAIYVAFLATGALFWARTRGRSPLSFLFVLSVMPFGFYFIALYTEGLYGLLTVLFLMVLGRSRWLPPLLSALATAARPTGILLLPLLIVQQIRCWRRGETGLEAMLDRLLGLLIAPLGLSLFMLFLYGHIGDALAFSHAQIGWGREFVNPLSVFQGLAAWHWRSGMETAMLGLYLGLPILLALCAGAWHGYHRRWAEAYLCLAPTLLSISAGTLSMTRFVICNPVVLFALTDLYALLHGTRLRAAVLVAMIAASVVLLQLWYRGAVFLF